MGDCMQVGDLVYARQCIMPDGKMYSAIGIIRSISDRSVFKVYEVWFPELGYGMSFVGAELILLEEFYNANR